MNGVTIFLTGLSGSGKSTIAKALAKHWAPVTILDGDVVREHLTKGLGFSKEDRDTNVRRIGWVAAEIAKHGGLTICAAIAPYDAVRKEIRDMNKEHDTQFVLVHVATSLEECEARDVKGLYKRARAGELDNFTGISDPYEVPEDAELVIDTVNQTIEESAAIIADWLTENYRL